MFRRLTFFICIMTAAIATVAQAQEEHFDVFVATSGNDTVSGGIDVDAGDVTLGEVVFEAEMGENPLSNIFFADEPGFNHPADDAALPVGTSSLTQGDEIFVRGLDLTVEGATGPLFYWDGVGSASFAAANGTTFDIVAPLPNQSLGTAGANGGFDDHPEFELSSGGTLPATGIYLGSFEAEVGGFAPTGANYLVMGTEGLITAEFLGISQDEFDLLTDDQLDEELEMVIEVAVDYVNANIVPEPNAFALAGIGVLVMMLRRRSSRQA